MISGLDSVKSSDDGSREKLLGSAMSMNARVGQGGSAREPSWRTANDSNARIARQYLGPFDGSAVTSSARGIDGGRRRFTEVGLNEQPLPVAWRSHDGRARNPGRVDLGGCPPRSPTDPGLHITRTRFLIS